MNENNARTYLAAKLRQENLALALGAGVSMDAGLPGWPKLLNRACAVAKLRKGLADEIAHLEDPYEAGSLLEKACGTTTKFEGAVKEALYEGISYSLDMARSRGLLAVGALLSGGQRGRVQHVISLNFDDVLEWFCELFGIAAQPITRVPCSTGGGVLIYHPHGFLPQVVKAPPGRILFSRRMAEERIGKRGEVWRSNINNLLSSKITIFYGLSLKTARDWVVTSQLRDIATSVDEKLPVGFWLFGRKIKDRDIDHLLDYRVVPLQVNGHASAAAFVLSISSEAEKHRRRALTRG